MNDVQCVCSPGVVTIYDWTCEGSVAADEGKDDGAGKPWSVKSKHSD